MTNYLLTMGGTLTLMGILGGGTELLPAVCDGLLSEARGACVDVPLHLAGAGVLLIYFSIVASFAAALWGMDE